jgi:hypothetical protein
MFELKLEVQSNIPYFVIFKVRAVSCNEEAILLVAVFVKDGG